MRSWHNTCEIKSISTVQSSISTAQSSISATNTCAALHLYSYHNGGIVVNGAVSQLKFQKSSRTSSVSSRNQVYRVEHVQQINQKMISNTNHSISQFINSATPRSAQFITVLLICIVSLYFTLCSSVSLSFVRKYTWWTNISSFERIWWIIRSTCWQMCKFDHGTSVGQWIRWTN